MKYTIDLFKIPEEGIEAYIMDFKHRHRVIGEGKYGEDDVHLCVTKEIYKHVQDFIKKRSDNPLAFLDFNDPLDIDKDGVLNYAGGVIPGIGMLIVNILKPFYD